MSNGGTMKNKLIDLNNHLFSQLEKLNDDTLTGDDLTQEIKRSEAMMGISEQILDVAKVTLSAARLVADQGGNFESMLPSITSKENINSDLPALAGKK